jgi:hypothetical protein
MPELHSIFDQYKQHKHLIEVRIGRAHSTGDKRIKFGRSEELRSHWYEETRDSVDCVAVRSFYATKTDAENKTNMIGKEQITLNGVLQRP